MPKNPDYRRGAGAAGTASSQKARRIPAAERVLDYILGEMDAGRLRPGARVNAARIAATLRLSAAPVREALSVLAGRGVLDLLPDRGAVIRPISAHEVIKLWREIQAALLYDYRTNVASYPAWQAWLREHKPPTLVAWGANDPSFIAAGATAYRADLPDAEIHLLEAGHFALEEKDDEIARLILDFMARHPG